MANGLVVLLSVSSVLVVVLSIYVFILYQKSNVRPGPSDTLAQPQPVASPLLPKVSEPEPQAARSISIETTGTNRPSSSAVKIAANSAVPKTAVVRQTDQAVAIPDDRNQRILAGISENIRKSLATRPVPQHSPIPYSELTSRNTEYVRVKREIITPHGQIRFSILKDSISTNMLAVFRRASLEWKTPDDLIAFLPSYLEPEAEILNDEVLLIGTPGHNEKLAVPIRSVDSESSFHDCFDFVTDVGPAINTPAVLLPSETEFEVVSRGVILENVLMNALERRQRKVQLIVEKPAEALQEAT
jgi:hypothetical protein